jgi:predicted transcriptional regulator
MLNESAHSRLHTIGTYELTPKGIRFLEIFTDIEDDLKPVSH